MKLVCLISILLTFVLIVNLRGADETAEQTEHVAAKFVELAPSFFPGSRSLRLRMKADERRFGHLTRPWETRSQTVAGDVFLGEEAFALKESNAGKEMITAYTKDSLLRTEEGIVKKQTRNDHFEYLRTSCRYSPATLVRHVLNQQNEIEFDIDGEQEQLVAFGSHGDENFECRFSLESSQLDSIVWKRHHEMWGDQVIEFSYSDWELLGPVRYPTSIVEKTFGTTTFRLSVLSAEFEEFPASAKIPADYQLQPDESLPKELVEVDKYNDRITFLHVTHTDSRSTIVEFNDFLLVIDAPVSSRNGQLILDKIAELNLGKPVRYFAFGHHHPHYLAGMRSFVAQGATILTTSKTVPYLKQLVKFPHTRRPDDLADKPQPLKLKIFDGEAEITDGEYSMKVFDIGLDSMHTTDYLLFYFPKEKLLFQDDGVWLRKNAPVRERTKAIYDAVKKRELEVVDCIQSWPTKNYGVKTKIKFSELDAAVEATAN
ncbi:MAG: hypothetical protein AB8B50_18665 [Pirellulaceae bacterium]